jgi:predicted nucleic acid-binding protein
MVESPGMIPSDPVVVDTDILIDVGRGVEEAVAYIRHVESYSTLMISAVTQMELIIGCGNNIELRAVEQFLSRFQTIALNTRTSDLAVDLLRRYRLSHGLLIADALIAATAMSAGEQFVTKNQRDYKFIEGLRLLTYPQ